MRQIVPPHVWIGEKILCFDIKNERIHKKLKVKSRKWKVR